jgi:hypothetical protein
VVRGHAQAVRTAGGMVAPAVSTGVLVRGNVLVESYDVSTVVIGGHHGLVEDNLALATIKDMAGKQCMLNACVRSLHEDTAAATLPQSCAALHAKASVVLQTGTHHQ